jgi:hypothetical protein
MSEFLVLQLFCNSDGLASLVSASVYMPECPFSYLLQQLVLRIDVLPFVRNELIPLKRKYPYLPS